MLQRKKSTTPASPLQYLTVIPPTTISLSYSGKSRLPYLQPRHGLLSNLTNRFYSIPQYPTVTLPYLQPRHGFQHPLLSLVVEDEPLARRVAHLRLEHVRRRPVLNEGWGCCCYCFGISIVVCFDIVVPVIPNLVMGYATIEI